MATTTADNALTWSATTAARSGPRRVAGTVRCGSRMAAHAHRHILVPTVEVRAVPMQALLGAHDKAIDSPVCSPGGDVAQADVIAAADHVA